MIDMRDAGFILFDQLKINNLFQYERYGDYSEESVEMALKAAEKLAVNEYYPVNGEGDRVGVVFADGKAKVPEAYFSPYRKFCEGGWTAPSESYDLGGQQLPIVVNFVTQMMFFAANQSLMVYTCLTHSAGKVVEKFGTEEQKKKYLEPLWSGRWGGCMDLTEPGAGSDVGAIRAKAIPRDDGTFLIKGNKLFISQGESDLTENLVHILLARIEGDPEGTKGLSCFIVPKIRVNDDGSLGEGNDVACTGVEHKMGMKGSATASLAYGDNNDCVGELIGGRGKGIVTMFHMMNEQRVVVGIEGLSMGSSAYLHALGFARERKQGAAFGQKAGEQVPIIEHPDIRKNLLVTKSYVEGIRALLLYTGYCMDMVEVSESEEERQKYGDLIEALTPICKAGGSDRGFDACVAAVQIHGGYGYCQEYYVEQLLRDSKITSIYEGTNGIQANDLMGRKISMRGGSAFETLVNEMRKTIEAAKSDALLPYAKEFEACLELALGVTAKLRDEAKGERAYLAYTWASQYLNVFIDLAVAWMLLDQAAIAEGKPTAGLAEADATFYAAKVCTAKFFIKSVLPQIKGRLSAIEENDDAILAMTDAYFTD